MRQKNCNRCGKSGLLSYAVRCPGCGGSDFVPNEGTGYSSAAPRQARTPLSDVDGFSSPGRSMSRNRSPPRNHTITYIDHVPHQRKDNDILPMPVDPVFDVSAPDYASKRSSPSGPGLSPKRSPTRLRLSETPGSLRMAMISDNNVLSNSYRIGSPGVESRETPNRSPRRKMGTAGQHVIEECRAKALASPHSVPILCEEPYLVPNKKSEQRPSTAASVLVYDNTARKPVRLSDYHDPRAAISPKNSTNNNNNNNNATSPQNRSFFLSPGRRQVEAI
eukprot:TRINITY_DN14446_c0_g1_i1.p1 TRINITY_DN14446_c0_g1~~TRINITY_DN14446_c0_g1_i1.p1  ORF type:complete len:277 (+),score=38.17 TRINITY_DN14446_c0_g1_i1:51-881(+)